MENAKEIPKLPEDLQQAINKFLPELIIDFNQESGKWEWDFRCANSVEDQEKDFDSPIEALVHFAAQSQNIIDELVGTFDDEDVNDGDFEEYKEDDEF